jgi:hypothetical protein
LRVEGACGPDQALPGVVADECGSFAERARGVAVAVGHEVFGGTSGDGEQLRESAEEAVLRVVFLVELAHRLREFLGADVAGEFVLDLLEGELGDPDFPDA